MRYIAFDSNYMCWYRSHSQGGMEYNGQATGSIHSFLVGVYTHCKKFGLSTPLFAFDSRKSIRKKILPSYKDRTSKATPQELETRRLVAKQIDIVRTIVLPTIGFNNIFIQTGLEGDDILGKLVRDNPGKLVVITGDEDLLQLTDEATWYSPGAKTMVNKISFIRKYGIEPRSWRLVKQLAGCSSDKVPGINGVGETKALKYLTGEMKKKGIIYDRIIAERKEVMKKNAILVNLPHPRTRRLNIVSDNFNVDGFLAICDIYGFERLSKQVTDWEVMFR